MVIKGQVYIHDVVTHYGGNPVINNISLISSLRPLVIGGAPQTKHLFNQFLGPTSLAEVHQRTGAIRDSNGT